jgi:GntR family transcriptional regulator, rspAB operon transcriptional repressor
MASTSDKSERPIYTASFVDQAYEYLLEKILNNEIAYGDVLNIKDLSKTLGISTMPIREAIKRLEYERLVEVKPRSSCQVRIPNKKEITAIYELRETLELFAVKKFLRKFDPNELGELEAIVDGMSGVAGISDPSHRSRRAMELDHSFHLALCRLADNEYVDRYYRLLSIHLNMAAIHAASYLKLADKYFESHAAIVASLKNQSDDAVKVLEAHFDNVWALIGHD